MTGPKLAVFLIILVLACSMVYIGQVSRQVAQAEQEVAQPVQVEESQRDAALKEAYQEAEKAFSCD